MNIYENLIFIVFSAVAVSYGWGMRGTILGAEKGAMLPGALMGLFMALFSGSDVLASSPWLLAGAGALGMFCGGNMTYAETLDFSMRSKPAPEMKKGMVALFLKGGLWFGLFGGYVSLMISVMAGVYRLWQILLFFALLPVFAFVFYFIFNKPYDKEKGIYPKIYFSVTRKETWGGLLGLLVEIVVFSAVFGDTSALVMTAGAFITGALGWVISQWLQVIAKHPYINGKRFLEKLNSKKAVDAWKIMECAYGALGATGCAVTFILAKPLFAEKFAFIDKNGLQSFIKDEKISILLAVIYFVILIADTVQYFITPAKDNAKYKSYRKFCEYTEFLFYCMLPMFFAMLGADIILKVIAYPVLLLVLFQEYAEKELMLGKGNRAVRLLYLLPCFAVYLVILFTGSAVGLFMTVLMYTFIYEAVFFLYQNLRYGTPKLSTAEKTVHIYFIVCCIITVLFFIFYI